MLRFLITAAIAIAATICAALVARKCLEMLRTPSSHSSPGCSATRYPHVAHRSLPESDHLEREDRRQANEPVSRPSPKKVTIQPFIPSAAFDGSRNGYVYKTGGRGLGYYLDKIETQF